MIIDMVLEEKSKRAPLRFAYKRMLNAGYTGRNQAEVRKHIEELARKGIPGPPATPTLYPVIRRALVKDPVIEVYSRETCGEAEYVLLIENVDRVYVGVGSDHTDRKLEEWDIPRAKQICPNVIGETVWALEDVAGHWDELTLRCRQVVDGKEILYQEGALARLMAPKELMAFVRSKIGAPLDGTIIFSGTMATLTGGFAYGSRLSAELEDPKLNRRLDLEYDVHPLDGFQ
ncbi:MAG TPA: DUF2848 family protein [Desulfobacterales bacterium]|nr:DUF2848 family protein [Desulfobacterales bacterium]